MISMTNMYSHVMGEKEGSSKVNSSKKMKKPGKDRVISSYKIPNSRQRKNSIEEVQKRGENLGLPPNR
jgi:hypothetical protein